MVPKSIFTTTAMTPLPLNRLSTAVLAAALFTTSAFAQLPAAAPDNSKIDLQDKDALEKGAVKIDPVAVPAVIPGAGRPAAIEPPVADTNIPGLEKLTPAQKQTVGKGIAEISGYMRGVRLQESLEKLNELEEITGDFHLIFNMRGAVFTKMRDFKAARAQFEKAVALTKNRPNDNFHPRFNIAEINFVEKNWAQARKEFNELIAFTDPVLEKLPGLRKEIDAIALQIEEFGGRDPDPTKPVDPKLLALYKQQLEPIRQKLAAENELGTRRLMEYKVFITYLQEKKMDEAKKILDSFDQYDTNSPHFYFASAASCFAKDQKEDGEEWLASASKVYPKEITDVFQDSLVEAGWLQTLQ